MLHHTIHNAENIISNECLIFLHGFTGTLEVWNPIVSKLLEITSHPVLLIDNLGGGKSKQPDKLYTSHEMAREVIKLISELSISKACIIGHSLGGAIAQHIALEKPNIVTKLILASSFASLDSTAKGLLNARYALTDAGINKELIARACIPTLFGNKFTEDESKVNLAVSRTLNNPQTLRGMRGQLHACISHNATSELKNLHKPTTIITGSADILVSPTHSIELHKLIKNSELIEIPKFGHMLPLECPQYLIDIIANVVGIGEFQNPRVV